MAIAFLDLFYGHTFKPSQTLEPIPIDAASYVSGVTVTGAQFSLQSVGDFQISISIEADFGVDSGSKIQIQLFNITANSSAGVFNIDSNTGESSFPIPFTVTSINDVYVVRAAAFSTQAGTIKQARFVISNLDPVSHIDSNSTVAVLVNNSGSAIVTGNAIAISAGGAILADASDNTRNLVGLALEGAAPNGLFRVQLIGAFEQSDWTITAGVALLTPNQIYFLSVTSGMLTSVAPVVTGEIVQVAGVALSTTVLDLLPDVSILL
jgi:hypothetical protein